MKTTRNMIGAAATMVAATVGLTSTVAMAAPATVDTGTSYGSLATVTGLTGARDMWACGWTGAGVGVALIDTGVAPVAGIGTRFQGPDLSFDGQAGAPAGVDAYGHGTHMASIINGKDAGFSPTSGSCRLKSDGTLASPAPIKSTSVFAGVAPGAKLVNLKVGANDGSADVTQLIAAINWVVENRATHNIKVLVMAVSVDSENTYFGDPITHAVEVARINGITVVAAAGNDGTTKDRLANPARNPHIIAVGSHDYNASNDPAKWRISDFSDRGWFLRPVDLVAPGRSIEGLMVPGSVAATMNPGSIVGTRFIKGSGSSQAAAVVGGLAALLIQRYPTATPAQIKDMLLQASTPLPALAGGKVAKAPVADLLLKAAPRTVSSPGVSTTGLATLTATRGSTVLSADTAALSGEVDVQGTPWKPATWASATKNLTTWSGGKWMGVTWTGTPTASGVPVAKWAKLWTGAPMDGSWANTGMSWDGFRWTGSGWTSLSWDGFRWTAFRWTGFRWTGFRWTGDTWTGFSWR